MPGLDKLFKWVHNPEWLC